MKASALRVGMKPTALSPEFADLYIKASVSTLGGLRAVHSRLGAGIRGQSSERCWPSSSEPSAGLNRVVGVMFRIPTFLALIISVATFVSAAPALREKERNVS